MIVDSTYEQNEEGSDFVEITVTFDDGDSVTMNFASWFDEPTPSARVQAASWLAALTEAVEREAEAERLGVHPLEIVFAPFGPEWQREQAERN